MPKHVLVTTKHRGVFAGYLEQDSAPASLVLSRARCAIKFGTERGFLQLASTGPTKNSRIGDEAPSVTLYDITSITETTPEAEAKWNS